VKPSSSIRSVGSAAVRTGKGSLLVRACLPAVIAFLVLFGGVADGYLKYGVRVGDRILTLRWHQLPVRYFVHQRSVPGVSAEDLREAVGRAFDTWERVPTARIGFEFAGFTTARPFDDDGMSTVGFLDRPELERVLGATSFIIDVVTGEIVESDIFFNATFPWSVAPQGEANRFDLESIAVHEIGHMFGLGHSAIGETELIAPGRRRVIAAETVMFPIAFSAGNIEGRTLRADDVAGVSDLYPAGPFQRDTGSVSGRVTMDGRGVFGAHLVAFNPQTGTLIGGFSLNRNGDFSIAGLTPGPHILRIEPLDDAEIESFFDADQPVETTFGVTFHEHLVVVPRGGGASTGEIRVVRR
jgi:hypothetical protein